MGWQLIFANFYTISKVFWQRIKLYIISYDFFWNMYVWQNTREHNVQAGQIVLYMNKFLSSRFQPMKLWWQSDKESGFAHALS